MLDGARVAYAVPRARAARNGIRERVPPREPGEGDLDARGPLTPDALEFAERVARVDHPVLLTGETGSGKGHLAGIIHRMSPRGRHPFVQVNCGAIPEALFEREMFGNARGAFTDAKEAQPGLFETAHRGTLFLDELAELPLRLQAKLLAVLDTGRVRRLGATRETPVDVRIIAATNRNLAELVAEGAFREDLFYRCAVLRLRLSPLRERPDDLPVLLRHLLRRLTPPGQTPPAMDREAMERLRTYRWPGNIRELENVLRHAMAYSADAQIGVRHLPPELRNGDPASGHLARKPSRYRAPEHPREERAMIEEALRAEGGNRTRAARRLGMSRSTFWIKLQRYGLIASPA